MQRATCNVQPAAQQSLMQHSSLAALAHPAQATCQVLAVPRRTQCEVTSAKRHAAMGANAHAGATRRFAARCMQRTLCEHAARVRFHVQRRRYIAIYCTCAELEPKAMRANFKSRATFGAGAIRSTLTCATANKQTRRLTPISTAARQSASAQRTVRTAQRSAAQPATTPL